MSVSVLWPCVGFFITDDWKEHMARPGYNRNYAGTDLARSECPLRGSQYNGKVLQAMWSTQGYGNTTFVEYYAGSEAVLRIRNAHQKSLGVKVGDPVTPLTNLGTLDSTGNSTGNHTHFEVWLKIAGQWLNIDPLDVRYDVSLVYDPSMLIPLEGGIPVPPPVYVPPVFPSLPKVKTSALITSYVTLRELPFKNSRKLSQLNPGEEWEAFASKTDNYSNVWLAVRKGDKVGWAAGYYGGEIYLVEV